MREDAVRVRFDLEDPMLSRVENWRRSQPRIPSRSEAIRRLIDRALDADKAEAAA